MPCSPVYKTPSGGTVIICGRGRWPVACGVCGEMSERLCDFKYPSRGTCDMPLCKGCSTPGAKANTDFCPDHVTQLVMF